MILGELTSELCDLSDLLEEYLVLPIFSFDFLRKVSTDETEAKQAIAIAIISPAIYLCNREMADPYLEEE